MKTSDRGLALIKKYEGLSLKAYQCPAGIWTIGYGSTKGVRPWTVITRGQAEQRLREDISTAEQAVDILRYLQPGLKQCQYDALVSFIFNVGCAAFNKSALRKLIIRDTEDDSIKNEFKRWVYVNGKVSPGLSARREEEAKLYFSQS